MSLVRGLGMHRSRQMSRRSFTAMPTRQARTRGTGEARPAARRPGEGGVPVLQASWFPLHHGEHFRFRLSQRRRIQPISHSGGWRRGGSGKQSLWRSHARQAAGPLLLLEDGHEARWGRPAVAKFESWRKVGDKHTFHHRAWRPRPRLAAACGRDSRECRITFEPLSHI